MTWNLLYCIIFNDTDNAAVILLTSLPVVYYEYKIQIQQLFLLRPLQSDRWRITEVSQHVFHSRRQIEIKMF